MGIRNYVWIIGLSLFLSGCTKEALEVSQSVSAVQAVHPLIAGVNWADARDNFVDGWVIPSGLEAGDNYATVATKSNAVYNGVISNLPGVNAIRTGFQ